MSCAIAQLNDIGTVFRLTIVECATGVPVNVSTATVLQMVFKRPDDTTVTKTAVFDTNGVDGRIRYTAIAGDLNVVGRYWLQAVVATPGGSFRSNVVDFTVAANL